MPRVRRRAVFLDRDGTLNERPAEHCYLRSPTQFRWLPGAREGAALLAKAGYVLAVVSNQRGLARGLLDRAALRAIEARVQRGLAAHGCRIEAFRYCPHDGASRANAASATAPRLRDPVNIVSSPSLTSGDP